MSLNLSALYPAPFTAPQLVVYQSSNFYYFNGKTLTLINTGISKVNTTIASIEASILTLQNGATSTGNLIVGLQGDVSTLQTSLSSADDNIAALQSNMANMNNEITALQTDTATADTNISTLQSNLTTLQSDVATIDNELAIVQNDTATADANIAALESDVASMSNSITSVQNTLAIVSGEISALQSSVATVLTTTVNLSNSQLLNITTTPVQVLPAPGNGLMYLILWALYKSKAGSIVMNINGGSGALWYGNPATGVQADQGDGSIFLAGPASYSGGTGGVINEYVPAPQTALNNQPIVYGIGPNESGYSGGNGTGAITVVYAVVPA